MFTVVPSGVFGPLASANREHYWLLLCRLFDEFFGPDAPLPPSIGLPRREITAAIERTLLSDDPWEDEDGDTPDTSRPVRAAHIYERFRYAGWLRQERIGAREMVSMPPAVSQLLSTLVEFAEHGPTFVSARMRSIELQLHRSSPQSGALLSPAAAELFRPSLYGDPAQTGLAYGLRCEDGWYPLIELVCLALQREAELRGAPQPVATTVKENAGTLRFRIREASDGQRAILAFAEDLSTLICEDCGHVRSPGLRPCPAGHAAQERMDDAAC